MAKNETVLKFDNVSFDYGHNRPILKEVSFSLRKGAKFALMGQNGAGKTTLFELITGDKKLESGIINVVKGVTVATAKQVVTPEEMELTVREFFQSRFDKKIYDIDPRIDAVLSVVNLSAPHDRKMGSFSGGQQARLLLASALVSNPDILLLDEPTNNLDKGGIKHLTDFLINYKKTCIVISHDADFLNAFTQGVLYLDVFTKKIEQYAGDYNAVVANITARIEKENRKNAQLEKEIQAKKDKANFFAHKGGQMRVVAKRMREKADALEEAVVDVRKEDKTIKPFIIPVGQHITGEVLKLSSVSVIKNHKPTNKKVEISLKRGEHLLLEGPNGIGKTTLLEALASGKAKGAKITEGVTVGYYRQDFSTLDFNETVYDSLLFVMDKQIEQNMRAVAAGFLITSEMMDTKIGRLSEGQKGLVAFARLVLERPSLLILDEPTNHINFRHIPIIAEALNKYEGAMVLVSHVPEFVKKIKIDDILDLSKLADK